MKRIILNLFLSIILLVSANLLSSAQGITVTSGSQYAQLPGVSFVKDSNYSTYVDKKGRFRLDSKTDKYSFQCSTQYVINESNDYSIEATLEQVDANDKKGYGLIIGFKDWDNYISFLITGNQYFKIVQTINGVKNPITNDWVSSKYISWGDSSNKLMFWKHDGEFIFAINGNIVHRCSAVRLSGNRHGFYVGGKGQFSLDSFSIKDEAVRSAGGAIPTTSY